MNHKAVTILALALIAAAVLGACQSITPQQAQAIVATYEALPAPQRTAVAEKAAAALQSLSADQKAAIKATMEAAQALAAQAHTTGAPPPEAAAFAAAPAPQGQPTPPAPQIISFFASEPRPEERAQGVAFFLNYDTVNATKVEIAGYVMDNPATGRWPVYGGDPKSVPDEWSIWAGNDTSWTDAWLKIEYDTDRGSTFQPVNVNSRNVTLSLRDPQYVDGDSVELRVNGQSFGNYVLDGRAISFPLVLVGGQNKIDIICTGTGAVANAIVEATLSNVSSGPATQVSHVMQPGQGDTLIVNAP
ncbi:MAG TPA: hypothetical protein VMP08_25685 [Anaerolineae bacterium]|nr:hypothetical protein [Anaerolineae bacterium]